MKKFFTREERDSIEIMNLALGTNHRSKPHNVNSADDMRHAAIYTIAEYMDLRNYSSRLGDMLESLDESIEYFYPATWSSFTDETIKSDRIALAAYTKLRAADDAMQKMRDRAEKKCKSLIKDIMGMPDDIQVKVWGQSFKYDMDKMVELFDETLELDSTYSIEESFEAFIALMTRIFSDGLE